jgi:hypothetical protein
MGRERRMIRMLTAGEFHQLVALGDGAREVMERQLAEEPEKRAEIDAFFTPLLAMADTWETRRGAPTGSADRFHAVWIESEYEDRAVHKLVPIVRAWCRRNFTRDAHVCQRQHWCVVYCAAADDADRAYLHWARPRDYSPEGVLRYIRRELMDWQRKLDWVGLPYDLAHLRSQWEWTAAYVVERSRNPGRPGRHLDVPPNRALLDSGWFTVTLPWPAFVTPPFPANWHHLTHTAQEAYREARGQSYAAYLRDVRQWCGANLTDGDYYIQGVFQLSEEGPPRIIGHFECQEDAALFRLFYDTGG